MKNVYGYHLPHGTLFLYGENLENCIPYINNIVNSVEDICIYCSSHNFNILYNPNRSFNGLIEYFRVYKIVNEYSVRGSWKEVSLYLSNKE